MSNTQVSPTFFFHEAFLKVVQTQDQVNQKLVGLDWVEKAANQVPIEPAGVVINYFDAITDEASELFRSAVPFKWWAKNTGADLDNTLIELVDILHFLVSHLIVAFKDTMEDTGVLTEEAVVAYLWNSYWDGHNNRPWSSTWVSTQSSADELASCARSLISASCSSDTENVAFYMWRILQVLNTTPKAFASMYFAKAELNTFRKAHGYKEGTYVKNWSLGGVVKEDNAYVNAYVTSYVAEHGVDCPSEDLQTYMSQAYQQSLAELSSKLKPSL